MDLSLVLQNFKHEADLNSEIYRTLEQLIQFTPEIPHPGSGRTFERWTILSQVAQCNLSLAKLFESHLDAISILNELQVSLTIERQKKLWAVWAAEGGPRPLQYHDQKLSGIKPWCSASKYVTHGLMTFRDTNQQSQLCSVDLTHSGIRHLDDAWHAVGMHFTDTHSIEFENVDVQLHAAPDQYLTRAGFWHGAAGVAVCWFGAALGLAHYLKLTAQSKPHMFKEMYLGQVISDIAVTKATLIKLADRIDQQPLYSHELEVRAVRVHTEQVCSRILDQVGKALGASPFCQNAHFAQLSSDLPVFMRQSHAAFDLAQIGQLALKDESVWQL